MDNEEELEEIEELSDESDFDSVDGYDSETSNNSDYQNESNDSNSEQLNHNSNEAPSNDETNLQQKLDENKGNSYNKANSDREAFSKTLDNKNYYNDKANQLKNDKNELEKGQKENKQRRDTAEKRLELAKQNRNSNKNKSTNQELKEAKKEAKAANKENKEQQRQEKMNQLAQKQIAKDEKKSKRFKAMHPVEAAKMQVQNKLNKVKKAVIAKVAAACAPIVLGLVLVFFVIQTILGPIMDAFGHIDKALTGVSNFSESISNFYYGFGFQDSKEAFYEEINGLVERYGSELDVPLLLSTLFYTEGMGYDTAFENIELEGAIDGSVKGSNQNIFNAIRGYMREKFDEANQTVDENGLVYNAGKIYRLRKLARNQFHTDIFGTPTREGKETSMSLSSFMEQYGERIKGSFIDALKNIAGASIAAINAVFKEIWAFIVGSDYQGDFFANAGFAAESAKDSILDLFADIFYGLADVTGISIGFLKSDEDGLDLFQIYVRVKTFEYDEDNYDKYLREYYIPNMPEFKEMLPSEGEAREAKIDQIINEIHANKQLFKDIFLQYVDTPAETYVEQCVGGIDLDLAKELTLPVKVPEGTTVNFVEGETAFGIRGGTNHNGIDLNSGTAGVNEGDPVYAIADGEVVNSLPNVACNTRTDSSCEYSQGAWVRIRHNIVIGQNEYNFYSVYMHLQTNSGQPAVGTKVKKGELIGKIGNTGDSSGAHLHFEIRDEDGTDNGQPLDPTNLFVPCKKGSSGTLVGDTIHERVWNYFESVGYNKFKIAAIMANIQNESGFRTNNLEDVCQTTYSDESITTAINSGKLGRQEFIASTSVCQYYKTNGQYDGRYGYGLAQWTAQNRKARFYDMKVDYGVDIDDEGLQLDLLYAELEEPWMYSGHESTWRNAKSFSDIGNASYSYCKGFEVGSNCDARRSVAEDYYNQYKDK